MIGPAIAIEKQLAPNVVNPPCASKIAWNNKTIIPRMETALGPNKIAPRPVPVIWEQLPVTEGIFRDDSTNTKAPAIAISVMDLRFSCTLLFSDRNPNTKNGRQTMPHAIQNAGGRYPSIICMAFAVGATARIAAAA